MVTPVYRVLLMFDVRKEPPKNCNVSRRERGTAYQALISFPDKKKQLTPFTNQPVVWTAGCRSMLLREVFFWEGGLSPAVGGGKGKGRWIQFFVGFRL